MSASLRVLIVDDARLARRELRTLLAAIPWVACVGEADDVPAAREAILREQPDLVLLDVQMPSGEGFDVLDGLETVPMVVFVTAYEQYAVKAFEANAVDYLVKPFSRERFAATLQRAKARLSTSAALGAQASTQILQALDALRQRDDYLQRIPVRVDEHVVLVAVDDIVWIKAARNTVEIHLVGHMHELRETMATLAARLDPRHFARVHRSAIVNVRRVKAIHPWFNGHHVVTMDTGQQLRMSRYQNEAFLKLVSTRSE